MAQSDCVNEKKARKIWECNADSSLEFPPSGPTLGFVSWLQAQGYSIKAVLAERGSTSGPSSWGRSGAGRAGRAEWDTTNTKKPNRSWARGSLVWLKHSGAARYSSASQSHGWEVQDYCCPPALAHSGPRPTHMEREWLRDASVGSSSTKWLSF